jgi:hypothetical protein
MTLPRFPVTVVGSWPRPEPLLKALRRRRRGEIARESSRAPPMTRCAPLSPRSSRPASTS